MNEQVIIDIVKDGLWVVITTAAPPLLTGLVTGLLISMFQTITSIQDATLTFVPKILAVLTSILLFGPYMLANVTEYMTTLFRYIPMYIRM